jgi:transcriptional regulator with XRE-family HTH domain
MKIQYQLTDDRLLAELGERIARLRLEKNLTQSELARQAGVGLRTVQRLEVGAVATQLSGFLRVCRTLGLIDRFDLLVPESLPSPMAQLKLAGKKRQRASGLPSTTKPTTPWKWEDEV